MKYFELMRPDWVPRAMGFYEKAAKTRESTYLEFPVRKKDGDRDLGRPARAADHHRRPHRRLPGHGARHHRSRQRAVGAARRARLRLGDPRHRAEPDHGARCAGPDRALQPRLRRAVRRVDVGSRRAAVLGSAVPARRGPRRHPRRHSAAGGRHRAGQARSHLGRQERRAAHDRVDGDGAARPVRRDVVPDRHRLGRDDGARARAIEVAVHLDGQPRAAHAADVDPRVDAAADRRRHDRQRRRRSARAGRALQRRSPDSHRQRHPRHVEDRGRRDDGVAEGGRGCADRRGLGALGRGGRAGCRRDDHASRPTASRR